ncbi:3-keto-disaccharide hydrolase [Pelagicoccus albus]|uniref:DUF1080 domain-containing protein n=1 Tax=Pelagicoccus albus TaxID=415222 RepID=A0A7X1B4X0_9BACT|nr:DUF1080 domain-containing protein [Pelagicoccus albus]MBC2605729.1 DUF1080 domain-containing protein [Pelagicoccus albus]
MRAILSAIRLHLCLAVVLAMYPICMRGEDAWISLFNGESLAGWTANENSETWKVEDGAIVAYGVRSHLFYTGSVEGGQFKNFEFQAEVKASPGSNSGIYFHTEFQEEGWPAQGYECQIYDGPIFPVELGQYVERKMTGSIYAVRNTWISPSSGLDTFTYRIRVVGKTIQTFINDELICEYTESVKPWREDDKSKRLLGSGTFALQAHDPGSRVEFRSLQVRPLPNAAVLDGESLEDAELDWLASSFANDNKPLIDIGFSKDELEANTSLGMAARKLGFTLISIDESDLPSDVAVIEGRDPDAILAKLKRAKTSGKRIVFSSAGSGRIDLEKIKLWLTLTERVGFDWGEFWVPN